MRATRLVVLLSAAVACGCTSNTSCALGGYFAAAAGYVASTIKLNSQADCSGYSRVNNEQSIAGPSVCSADPGDGACVACLRGACCSAVEEVCMTDAGALDAATCAAEPTVRACILGALGDNCAGVCPQDGGAP